MRAGHTLAEGRAGGCPICEGYAAADGNPAHEIRDLVGDAVRNTMVKFDTLLIHRALSNLRREGAGHPLWVIIGEEGKYSDHSEWPVAWVRSEAEADAAVAALTAEHSAALAESKDAAARTYAYRLEPGQAHLRVCDFNPEQRAAYEALSAKEQVPMASDPENPVSGWSADRRYSAVLVPPMPRKEGT